MFLCLNQSTHPRFFFSFAGISGSALQYLNDTFEMFEKVFFYFNVPNSYMPYFINCISCISNADYTQGMRMYRDKVADMMINWLRGYYFKIL